MQTIIIHRSKVKQPHKVLPNIHASRRGKKKIKPLCSFICLLFILSTAQALQQITWSPPQGFCTRLSHRSKQPASQKSSCQSVLSLIECCLMVSQLLPWELLTCAKTKIYTQDRNMQIKAINYSDNQVANGNAYASSFLIASASSICLVSSPSFDTGFVCLSKRAH